MSNFFNDEQLNNITLKENNIQNVNDFSRASLDTTLGDLPTYEDLYKKEIVPTKNIEFSQIEQTTTSSVADREFKKQVDKEKAVIRARVKIFLTVFSLITLLITGFVIYNLIAMINLSNKVENNDVKIKVKREQIEREEQENSINALRDIEIPSDLNKYINI